jgi:hexosaminidase
MKYFKSFVIIGILSGLFSFSSPPSRPEAKIVPQPAVLTNLKGTFILNQGTKILINNEREEMKNIVSFLSLHLKTFYGIENKKVSFSATASKKSIFIKLDHSINTGKEGYHLKVTSNGIVLEAAAPNGLFYGIQTIIQLMPASRQQVSEVVLPSVEINDFPRFAWRGLHLDVGRHFMPEEFVLKYLDYMAMHKFNTFHWHLTEDQGWRIEIKKYPRLTEIGSKRKETLIGHGSKSKQYDNTPYGGFYTQEEVKEIVAYAAKRYITVVPEIEMPGHALAALASYPEYGCTGGPYEIGTRWGIFDDVYCAGKETTFAFLQDVIDEVIPLFPGQYFHIGGDECPKNRWEKCPVCQKRMRDEGLKNEQELQSYFVQRIEKYLNKKGKKMIGWDEILEGGLAPNAAVMSWRGEKGGIAAAKQQHDVVMTPANYCYLNLYQADPKTEPLAIGGNLSLEKTYSYEPIPAELNETEAKFVLGAQGSVWTEYIKTPEIVEYMVFPRVAALSEVVWSPKKSRNYANFKDRMRSQVLRYEAYGINYCKKEF